MSEKISDFLKEKIDSFTVKPPIYYHGTVTSVGDGVAQIKGLHKRRYGELLEFENGVFGMALDLSYDGVGAVLLDATERVGVGCKVRGSDVVASVPVGDELLGRVIDSIGRPLDGIVLECDDTYPVERPAPTIIERQPIKEPLETGYLAIDSMIPIGKGQRELIIGDRQTGKTTVAIDTILNQAGKDVICVYCAIGQKASNIASIVKTLKKSGAMNYSVVVSSTASDSPAMQYLAPYAACSVAEFFMSEGRDVLVVYDDLSKHAVAYRTMSLLLHRPPGREAYPGDVFYLHSRLLERSAKLRDDLGGGSITSLPIIETTGGNISAYIPTNVISITDGQIFLESELFNSGIRPAINTGLSVSRVGRSAQYKAMQRVSGTLRIELSQYREMAVFTRFGSDIDHSTQKLLKRGTVLTKLLVQQKNSSLSLFEEVLILIAYKNGLFDNTDINNIHETANQFITYVRNNHSTLESVINSSKELDKSSQEEIEEAIEEFLRGNINEQR